MKSPCCYDPLCEIHNRGLPSMFSRLRDLRDSINGSSPNNSVLQDQLLTLVDLIIEMNYKPKETK